MWIGTEGQGLFIYESSRDYFEEGDLAKPVNLELPADSITTITTDSVGRLWVGYFKKGISIIYNDQIRNFEYDSANENSLINNEVRDVFIDQTGVIWIGTWDGVSRVSSQFEAFDLYVFSDLNDQLNDERVVSFEEETKGGLLDWYFWGRVISI